MTSRRVNRDTALVPLMVALLVVLGGILAPNATAQPSIARTGASQNALDALDALPVKGRAPKTGYSRSQFGPSWKDTDRNGCDTRNDVLIRDLVERQMSGKCKVLSGVLYPDPYTGQKIVFTLGKSLIDIDHVVALGNAWETGAQQIGTDNRTSLANDPLNLLAVDYSANRQKGDADAATWLPSNKGYRCQYVARQIAVKQKYHLWVTAAEKNAMKNVLSGCPGQKLPTNATFADPVGTAPTAKPTPTTVPMPTPAPSSGSAPYFKTCADARAAGQAPLRAGTAVYDANTHLDANHDGIACN